jgi:signal transduction histidine kinase
MIGRRWHAPHLRFGLMLGAIAALIGGLLLAFSLSLGAASRQFEHALIAQRQAAQVSAIAQDAGALSAAALQARLAAYRASIEQERPFLSRDEQPGQEDESRRAGRLAALASLPGDHAALVAMVGAIAADEGHEVARARQALDQMRRNTIALGVLLALAAMGATVAGALQLRRANRDLAAEVAARTAELRSIDQSRRLFFAKASHELRTPVTAIRAIAEVALDTSQSQDGLALPLHNIVAQTIFLGHRIEEMLALSNAAQGRPIMALALHDLADVVEAALAQARPYASSIHVGIRQTLPAVSLMAIADRRWLSQALVAVIENGLKFSDPHGDLDVSLSYDGASATIAIADTGPGVLPRDLPRIFEAYYQAEAGRMRGGTGLGLALARWVVEQHGGSVLAENRAEGGCRIVINLPLAGALTGTEAGARAA